ncbi:hypothetical protein BU24DRAFT_449902 [Aaosphaeria arxii CBS 175.79]|uniref:Uncharacterized protein n=1 Tax=Aaosphaeria arxii CBS 175.79 TaxID=1450172 RepID=A0A6A5XZW4_9PLEO|nr:uncharacterized protein BU24DRAFT_449902 [Aaosphaeria arxii CBS 175.79]KAF2018463.1 hypothetical protein BU24DRAFT_449902 [Aaosphaeria arxii CBS 175.79]
MMGRLTKTETAKASRGANRSSRAASTIPKKRKPSPKTSTERRKVRKKTSTGIEHENESETENASTQAEIEELKAELKAAVARSEGLEVQIERDQMDHIQELQKKEADIDVLKSLLEGAKKELSNHKDERAKFEANTMNTIATLAAERDQLLRQSEKPKPPNPHHPSPRRASPAPVAAAVNPAHLDENMRVENVRKTYLSIKRRYDTLCCITKEVVRCTRGMYLSNFGDFGRLLEQLRNAMEDQDKPAEHPGVEGGKSGLTATPLSVDSQGTVGKGSQGPQA